MTENALKWHAMEPRQGQVDYSIVDAILQWTDQHEIPLRGHNIFWGVPNRVQPWQKDHGRRHAARDAQGPRSGRRQALPGPVRRVRPEQRDAPRELLRGPPGPGDHAGHGVLGPPGRPQGGALS